MALFTRGNPCTLCRLPMENRREVIIFPHLVGNLHDPLFVFNGAVAHKTCVHQHPWGKMAVRQKQFVHETILPNTKRECALCHQKITDAAQLIATGVLTTDSNQPLSHFNWLEVHKKCLSHWKELPVLVNELQKFAKSGKWVDFTPEHRAMDKLLDVLQPLVPGRAENARL
jgi:hypothetical protein